MIPSLDIERDFETCLTAVQMHFKHLSMEQVRNPPNDMLDAKLARQIAYVILVEQFSYPRRRVCMAFNRNRGSIKATFDTIKWRRRTLEFEAVFQEITSRAVVIAQAKRRYHHG